MASPLGSTVASVPGSVLPCGVVLYGGSAGPGTSTLSCRPSVLEPRVPTLPGPGVGQILPPVFGLDPVSMQLARLSRYQQAAAAAACLITGTPGHQSSAGHLLSYLYACQQQQQRLQQDRCHPSPGETISEFFLEKKGQRAKKGQISRVTLIVVITCYSILFSLSFEVIYYVQ